MRTDDTRSRSTESTDNYDREPRPAWNGPLRWEPEHQEPAPGLPLWLGRDIFTVLIVLMMLAQLLTDDLEDGPIAIFFYLFSSIALGRLIGATQLPEPEGVWATLKADFRSIAGTWKTVR